MTKAKVARRVMKDFIITEISAVDRPAQEGARAVIMKRADVDKAQGRVPAGSSAGGQFAGSKGGGGGGGGGVNADANGNEVTVGARVTVSGSVKGKGKGGKVVDIPGRGGFAVVQMGNGDKLSFNTSDLKVSLSSVRSPIREPLDKAQGRHPAGSPQGGQFAPGSVGGGKAVLGGRVKQDQQTGLWESHSQDGKKKLHRTESDARRHLADRAAKKPILFGPQPGGGSAMGKAQERVPAGSSAGGQFAGSGGSGGEGSDHSGVTSSSSPEDKMSALEDIDDELANSIDEVGFGFEDAAEDLSLALRDDNEFAINRAEQKLRRFENKHDRLMDKVPSALRFDVWEGTEVPKSVRDRFGKAQERVPAGSSAYSIRPSGGVGKSMQYTKRLRLTSAEDGHSHLVDDSLEGGTTSYDKAEGEEYGHTHPWVRNDDGTITIGESSGHGHEVMMTKADDEDEDEDVTSYGEEDAEDTVESDDEEQDDEQTAPRRAKKNRAESADHIGNDDEDDMTDTKKNVAGDDTATLQKTLTATQAENARLTKMLDLNDAERSFMKALPKDQQDAFLAAPAVDRVAQIRKANEANEIVYKTDDGREFRKSDDPRLVAMAKQNDETSRELRKAREEQANAAFAKRADDEIPNLPGTAAERGAMLKALETMPAEARDSALKALKAGSNALAGTFKRHGNADAGNADSSGSPHDQLDKKAKELAKSKNISYIDAYDVVRKENPELYAKAVMGPSAPTTAQVVGG